jgi:hypothetical protein
MLLSYVLRIRASLHYSCCLVAKVTLAKFKIMLIYLQYSYNYWYVEFRAIEMWSEGLNAMVII